MRHQPWVQDSDVVNLLREDFPDHKVEMKAQATRPGIVYSELFVDGEGPCITWDSVKDPSLTFQENMMAETALYAVLHRSIQSWLIDVYGQRKV